MFFSKLSKWISIKLGHSYAFAIAFSIVIFWAILGPFFNFNDTWQLCIDTLTSISTFLMVFLLQNTQNRDTKALHLKLDEIIRSIDGAHNKLLKVEELSDDELEELHISYQSLAEKVRTKTDKGEIDTSTPNL